MRTAIGLRVIIALASVIYIILTVSLSDQLLLGRSGCMLVFATHFWFKKTMEMVAIVWRSGRVVRRMNKVILR